MSPLTCALEFRHVTVQHRGSTAPIIEDLSFAIPPEQRVALLGLNGSGKTTLLLAAVGLLPAAGDITIMGTPVVPRAYRQVRAQVGFVFSVPEDQLLLPTVIDDVILAAVHAGMTRDAARERALQMLGNLGVAHLAESPLHRLSHGQKQRVALAGALVTAPPLLLFDEPSAGLDPPAKRQLARYLTALPAALLVATHDIAFAEAVCQRFLVLDHGQLREHATPPVF